ncbi:ankyrin repeat domain-containing protein [Leptospira noguchii]|uniref:Ankyrin repeat domain-containing protein n=1 Tax=Leptospira noguchii TaxID=28182 RepID=A0A9Q8RQX8_9LEPT|nr:ankyrin repeat domain-containing protein [Leptospira noguchii]MCH1911596.1 ankyrin repeat domain-containing protein [Leptospira noguchii]MCH1914671.1 ankyrin repeat domain-containing protein [Leptospira noguchii]TQE65123.1 ankyrin repeat domain-containing protein [Leptospira noguchii]UOG55024.1 ankyrin repeat domain-containing protein [Leptospira noguchii]UOG58824.1 ankyrin repeat domain-containing protein [Leptospira noguchii]
MNRTRLFILLFIIPWYSVFSAPIHELLKASERGNIKKIESILKSGKVDINGYDKDLDPYIGNEGEPVGPPTTEGYGFTALHWAVYKGHFEAVQYLVEHGANVNAEKPDEDVMTPIFYTGGNEKIIRYLISQKADVFKKDYLGYTLLYKSVSAGRLDLLKMYIDLKLDVNEPSNNSETPLHEASYRGYDKIVKLLLEHGAKVNTLTVVIKQIPPMSSGGHTPLHYAVLSGKLNTAKILLKYGADKTIKNGDGETPLDIAKKKGNKELIELLK